MKVIGITSNHKLKGKVDGIPFIQKSDIPNVKFDYLIVTPNKFFKEIISEIGRMGIESNKVIRQDVVKIPGFTFEKYKKLRDSNLSIISSNCFGGVLYNRFGMQFLSPTINMWQSQKDFLKFAANLKGYLNCKLQFSDVCFNPEEKLIYPLYSLNDIKLQMNHYTNFDEAEKKWYERVNRINWDNLMIVMNTQHEEYLEEFESLPYDKKICFVPFKSDLKSAFYLPFIGSHKQLSRYVIHLAQGRLPLYDLWDLMLYGKKTPRVDFNLM